MKNELSIMEEAVLKKLLDGHLPLLIQLRRQLEQCTVAKREFTGHGFFTELTVPENIPRTTRLDIKFGDVIGEVPGLANGAGFLLYVKDGILDMLEGYSYDEPWPLSIEGFKLKYTKGEERDWVALGETLRIKA